MDRQQRRQRQASSPRGNASAHGSGGARPGKHKGSGGKGGGKKPIKVVYISNTMRVKTSASEFRALVQELTGRDADPSKYTPEDFGGGVGGAAAAGSSDIDSAAQVFSPGDAAVSSDTTIAASPGAAVEDRHLDAAAVAPHGGYYDDGYEDIDGFRSQLLENNYAMFSPPTLLYDHHPDNKFPFD